MEFIDFSLIGPVSTRFTNYFAISLKNSCVRRKHSIKILKTICTRYCNDLVHMVFRFPIYNTEPVKEFFEKKSKKNTDKSPIIRCFDSTFIDTVEIFCHANVPCKCHGFPKTPRWSDRLTTSVAPADSQ